MTPEDRWRFEIFSEYAGIRRVEPIPGFEIEVLPDITRYRPAGVMGDEALVAYARFPDAEADRRVAEELRTLRERGWEGEWKLHDFDEPGDLKGRLEALGLTNHHVEALMVLDLAIAQPRHAQDDDVVIERATGSKLDEIAALQEEVWNVRLPWLRGVMHLTGDPDHGTGVVFCARDGARVVGSGWIELHAGSRFTQLCGGAVHPDYRGRGIYSRLFERRVIEAKARGAKWMAVEAAPMSRPILEKKGFRFVCNTYPMRTRPYDTGAVTRA
jgi:GNAT superfamily N-acetyltransferase